MPNKPRNTSYKVTITGSKSGLPKVEIEGTFTPLQIPHLEIALRDEMFNAQHRRAQKLREEERKKRIAERAERNKQKEQEAVKAENPVPKQQELKLEKTDGSESTGTKDSGSGKESKSTD
jgi:hypothetical protein